TREGKNFLVLNGIQTQSAPTHVALEHFAELDGLHVDVLRISPQAEHTMDVLALFDAARQGGDPAALGRELLKLLPGEACNGYLVAAAGMDHEHPHAA
ncbi:MAG: hypothetical protein PVI83_06290, partial [Lysobacterales bacterium]